MAAPHGPRKPECADDAVARVAAGREASRRDAHAEAAGAFAAAYACTGNEDTSWHLAVELLRAEQFVEARERFLAYLKHPGARPERARRARTVHLPFLAARIGKLQVRAPEGSAVLVDGVETSGPWSEARAVVAGDHTVTVPLATPEITHVRVAGGETTVVVVEERKGAEPPAPVVAAPVAAPSDAPARAAPTTTSRVERIGGRGWVTGGLLATGLASAGAGAYFVLDASHARSRAATLETASAGSPCLFYGSRTCSSLLDANQRAASGESLARGFFVASATLTVAAAIVWLTWPRREVTVSAWSDPRSGGVSVRGRF